MANIITKRFDFTYKPLKIISSLTPDGDIPSVQTYNSTDGYLPDYTLTPLVLQLRVAQIDPEGILANGSVNAALTNVCVYEIIDGEETQITSASTDYTIVWTGADAGQVQLLKNVDPEKPITIRVEADYLDTRTQQVFHIAESFLVRSEVANAVYQVKASIASETIWNPLRDDDSVTIEATLFRGGAVVEGNFLFLWQKLRSDGTFTAVGSEDTEDYDMTVSGDNGQYLTIDRRLMGTDTSVRVLGFYNPDGVEEVSDDDVADTTPFYIFTIIRRIPDAMIFDYNGVPTNIPADIASISPTAVAKDTNGVVDTSSDIIYLWKVATNTATSKNLSYTQVAHGENPTISTSYMSVNYGMVLALDPQDCKQVASWADSDGAILTDSDGAQLLIH